VLDHIRSRPTAAQARRPHNKTAGSAGPAVRLDPSCNSALSLRSLLLAADPIELRLLLVAERVVEVVERGADGAHRLQHRIGGGAGVGVDVLFGSTSGTVVSSADLRGLIRCSRGRRLRLRLSPWRRGGSRCEMCPAYSHQGWANAHPSRWPAAPRQRLYDSRKLLGVSRRDLRRFEKIAGLCSEAKDEARRAKLDDVQNALLEIAEEPAAALPAGMQTRFVTEVLGMTVQSGTCAWQLAIDVGGDVVNGVGQD
jgi:hypothetical protein